LNYGPVKNNDMISQYLSNSDLYSSVQVSQMVSNAMRDFMKKREKEQKEKEQKLKEHFFYDFNAFIDYARIASLDYLEIKIPEKVLNSFLSVGIYNNCPTILVERSYCLNKPPKIIIIGFEPDGVLRRKEYQLQENETLKFKFHFQHCLDIQKNHHVTLFEQTFGFTDLFFTLFRKGRKKFKFAADSRLMPNYQLDDNYVYKKQNCFKSNPKFRVQMVEETGLKFKFKFYTFQTDNHYTFDRPIYDFDNLFPNFKNYF